MRAETGAASSQRMRVSKGQLLRCRVTKVYEAEAVAAHCTAHLRSYFPEIGYGVFVASP